MTLVATSLTCLPAEIELTRDLGGVIFFSFKLLQIIISVRITAIATEPITAAAIAIITGTVNPIK